MVIILGLHFLKRVLIFYRPLDICKWDVMPGNSHKGFPGGSVVRNPAAKIWVRFLGRRSPRVEKWQPTPVFLLGKSLGQRSLVGYSPWCCKRVGHNSAIKQQQIAINLRQGQGMGTHYSVLFLLCVFWKFPKSNAFKMPWPRDFPGDPVKTFPSIPEDMGSIPG